MRILQISIFFLIFVPFVHPQCCLRFQGKKCAECPLGTHLFRGNCIIDVKDCSLYKDGFDCSTCNPGFQLNSLGDCQKISSTVAPPASQQTTSDFTDFTDTFINLNNMQASNSEYYLLTDEYLRSTRPQILEATTTGARIRIFKNRTAEVTIEYVLNKNIYYRGVMKVSMDTFILQEKQFGKVASSILDQLSQNNVTNSNSVAKVDPISISQSELLSLLNPQHLQKLRLLENYLLTQNQPITSLKSGNLTSFGDGSFNISSIYATKSQNIDLFIRASISKEGSVKIIEIKNLLKSTQAQIAQQKAKPYMDLNIADLADENYLICKDLIWTQFAQLKGIQPSSGKKYTENSTINYLMRFSKADGSVLDIQISLDSTNFIGKVGKITQVSTPTKTQTPATYVKVDNSQIYKDIYFIITLQYINKQSNNKYKDSPIRFVEKYENGTVINYRINFQTPKFIWQVLANINVSTFVASGFTESQKQSINNSTETINSNSKNSSNNIQLSNKITSDDSSNKDQINKTQNISDSTSQNSSQSTSQNSSQSTSQTTTQNSSQNSSQNKGQKNSSQANTNSQGNSITSNPTNQSNQIKVVNQNNNGTNVIVQNNNSNQNQVNNNKSSIVVVVSQNSSSTSIVTQSKQQTANVVIQELTNGLTSLSKTDMNTVQFREIDSLLRMANQSELKNSIIVGAYLKNSSFTKNYQIYYMQQQGNQDIFAAVVSRDQLRKRTYIISFGKIGY